jgi:hypothetical protein
MHVIVSKQDEVNITQLFAYMPGARQGCKLCKFRSFYNPKNMAGVVSY